MGCWNETCGLTGFPIWADDEIVMIVFKDEKSIRSLTGRYCPEILDFKSIVKIVVGKYDDYGWVKDEPEDDPPVLYRSSLYFHKSAWDTTLAFAEKDQDTQFYMNGYVKHVLESKALEEKVWKNTFERCNLPFEEDQTYNPDNPAMAKYWDFVKILYVAERNRIGFSDSLNMKHQDPEVPLRLKLREVEDKIMANRKKEMDEWGEEHNRLKRRLLRKRYR